MVLTQDSGWDIIGLILKDFKSSRTLLLFESIVGLLSITNYHIGRHLVGGLCMGDNTVELHLNSHLLQHSQPFPTLDPHCH